MPTYSFTNRQLIRLVSESNSYISFCNNLLTNCFRAINIEGKDGFSSLEELCLTIISSNQNSEIKYSHFVVISMLIQMNWPDVNEALENLRRNNKIFIHLNGTLKLTPDH